MRKLITVLIGIGMSCQVKALDTDNGNVLRFNPTVITAEPGANAADHFTAVQSPGALTVVGTSVDHDLVNDDHSTTSGHHQNRLTTTYANTIANAQSAVVTVAALTSRDTDEFLVSQDERFDAITDTTVDVLETQKHQTATAQQASSSANRSTSSNSQPCIAFGKSLSNARDAYQSDCTRRRVDCDPVAGGWLCSSRRMINGDAAALWAQHKDPLTDRELDNPPADCTAVADNLAQARRAYQNRCSAPRLDCDPLSDGRWLCASRRMANGTADALVNTITTQQTDTNAQENTELEVISLQIDTPNDNTDVVVESQRPADPTTVTNNTLSSSPSTWSDSYAVGDQCFCDSSFDHGLNAMSVETPQGMKSVRQICADIRANFGNGGLDRTYYNTSQCGHPPANNAPDEANCPGIIGGSAADCLRRGATWNLDRLYPQPEIVESSGTWWQPQASEQLSWQLQLQGNINTAIDADVYFIDADVPQATINALKSQGKRVMCYISAGSIEDWRSDASQFPSLVIGNDYHGWLGEKWLNVRDIDALAPIMRARLDQCQRKGFDGIDADNVNGHINNTGFSLTRQDVIRFIRWLADESHARGMAFSLKNTSDVAMEVVGSIDMMQMESCHHWRFCDDATDVVSLHNKPVFMVEYREINQSFNAACDRAAELGYAAIYRNLQLTGDGIYEACD